MTNEARPLETCTTIPSVLTEDIALNSIRSFFHEKPFLVFGTGMSCALDSLFGMEALQEVLLQQIKDCILNSVEKAQWQQVKQSIHRGVDLESSLDNVTDQGLLYRVTAITGRFVASTDREYALQIADGQVEWPAIHLIKRLADTLPDGDPILHALTPNYDLLFEHACDHDGIVYSNGFMGGIERRTDWQAVDRAMMVPEQVLQRGKMKRVYKCRKHIRLYKVHGSLNYFFHKGIVIENNAWMWNPPDFAQRVIITPGLSKYQTLQNYRQELLNKADTEIERANSFLFLGYGFNDRHLEEYIKRKLITQGCKGLILTRDSNPRIESLIEKASNLWLVCRYQDMGRDCTRIRNKQYSDCLILPDRSLWEVGEFSKQILGV